MPFSLSQKNRKLLQRKIASLYNSTYYIASHSSKKKYCITTLQERRKKGYCTCLRETTPQLHSNIYFSKKEKGVKGSKVGRKLGKTHTRYILDCGELTVYFLEWSEPRKKKVICFGKWNITHIFSCHIPFHCLLTFSYKLVTIFFALDSNLSSKLIIIHSCVNAIWRGICIFIIILWFLVLEGDDVEGKRWEESFI